MTTLLTQLNNFNRNRAIGSAVTIAGVYTLGITDMIKPPISNILIGFFPSNFANGLATGIMMGAILYGYFLYLDDTVQKQLN
jgi:hypothetical protein